MYHMQIQSSGKLEYFYRVSEFVSLLDGQSFNNDNDFKGDLKTARENAYNFFKEREKGFENGEASFHLPFASPNDFQIGENATYSLTLYLVESYSNGEEFVYPLAGESEEEVEEGLQTERDVLKQNYL